MPFHFLVKDKRGNQKTIRFNCNDYKEVEESRLQIEGDPDLNNKEKQTLINFIDTGVKRIYGGKKSN
jgi:hypothetical protein